MMIGRPLARPDVGFTARRRTTPDTLALLTSGRFAPAHRTCPLHQLNRPAGGCPADALRRRFAYCA